MNRRLEVVEVGKIRPYERNPRKNDAAVDDVRESIRQCGYVSPIIVDEQYVILAGHTRFKAVKALGWAEVEVQVVEGLTEEQKRKFRILDNKAGEKSEWAEDLLKAELADLDFNGYDFDFCLDDDDLGGEDEKPEVEFSEELQEENNFVVLVFKTEIDWLQAQTILGLKTVKSLSAGVAGERREGIGRVVDGVEAIERIKAAARAEA